MARTGFFHHIGSFLLFTASILMLITSISAPVVNDISIMRIELDDGNFGSVEKINFGTFGYCIISHDADDQCTHSKVGYQPVPVVESVAGSEDFSSHTASSVHGLTKALILNPIACGLLFIAFLLGAGSGFVGSFLASLVAALAFVVTLVILIIDFVLFSILRHHVNNAHNGAHAKYGSAAWTTLVAAILALIGTIVIFLTCCSSRFHRQRPAGTAKAGY